MKSKNIPDDIKSKSIEEAQTEISDIMVKLESKEAKLEQSMDQYNRMIQLNQHIQDKFKERANEIRNLGLKKNTKKKTKKPK